MQFPRDANVFVCPVRGQLTPFVGGEALRGVGSVEVVGSGHDQRVVITLMPGCVRFCDEAEATIQARFGVSAAPQGEAGPSGGCGTSVAV